MRVLGANRLFPAALALALCACSPKGPTAEAPFAIILASAATHQSALNLAESLTQSAQLEDTAGVTIKDGNGGTRHLVLSRGFGSEEKARARLIRLSKQHGVRLELIDIRSSTVLEAEAATSVSPPEDSERIERVANLLPDPGQAVLRSFLIRTDPSKRALRKPYPAGWAAPPTFSRGLGALGFQAIGEATYLTAEGAPGDVRVFAGLVGEGKTAEQQLQIVHNYVVAHSRVEVGQPSPVAGDDEQDQPALAKNKKRKKSTAIEKKGRRKRALKDGRKGKKRRKASLTRRKKRQKRRRRPEPVAEVAVHEPEKEDLAELSPVEQEPLTAQEMVMPWGKAQVYVVKDVAFVRTDRINSKTRLRTAWITSTPDQRALVVVLFDDPELAAQLIKPKGLGEQAGLASSVWLSGIWSNVPEVAMQDEKLSYVGKLPLGQWISPKKRKAKWARSVGRIPVLLAGYAKDRTGWQMAWHTCAEVTQASTLYEQGYVAPRQAQIQRMLNAKRAVKYDMGVTLKEVGDVTAWNMLGAERGRLQDLYFLRGRQVFLLRGAMPGSNGLDQEDFLARAENLPIWDRPPL